MDQERSSLSEEHLRDQNQQQLRVRTPENQMASQNNQQQPDAGQNQPPPPPPQKCPRCDSSNTKFCYYNNYSLSQPRYFCKACRRYWTQGGTLRNVPVGGGCRKSKRSRNSAGSSSTGSEIARTQPPAGNIPAQNLTGMISGQSLRALPPVIQPMGNSLFAGGELLSSFTAMQSLPAGISQRSTANMGGGGGFGANVALLQGLSFQSLKTPAAAPPQYQPQNENFSSQQSMISSRPSSSWTQTFINRGASSSSGGIPTFWSGATNIDGGDQAGSSFSTSQWSDINHPGYSPPQ